MGIYKLLGMIPIEGILHQNALSLFHNMWSNRENSMFRLLRYQLAYESKSYLWIHHIRYLSKLYGIPDPGDLMSTEAPSKQEWKRYVKEKVQTHWEEKIDSHLKKMSTTVLLRQEKTILDGKMNRVLIGGKTFSENNAIIVNVKMLIDEYANNKFLYRIGKSVTPNCSNCRLFEDDNTHIITSCCLLKHRSVVGQYGEC